MRMWFTAQPTFTITTTCIACFPFNIKQPTSWLIALRIFLSAKYSSPRCYGTPRENFYIVLTMPSLPSSIPEIEGIAWGADMPSATRTSKSLKCQLRWTLNTQSFLKHTLNIENLSVAFNRLQSQRQLWETPERLVPATSLSLPCSSCLLRSLMLPTRKSSAFPRTLLFSWKMPHKTSQTNGKGFSKLISCIVRHE